MREVSEHGEVFPQTQRVGQENLLASIRAAGWCFKQFKINSRLTRPLLSTGILVRFNLRTLEATGQLPYDGNPENIDALGGCFNRD
jgi:hypothetical protein